MSHEISIVSMKIYTIRYIIGRICLLNIIFMTLVEMMRNQESQVMLTFIVDIMTANLYIEPFFLVSLYYRKLN